MTTVAPSFASSFATWNPIPVAPPVMIPTRPSNVLSGSMQTSFSGVEAAIIGASHGCVERRRNGWASVRQPLHQLVHLLIDPVHAPLDAVVVACARLLAPEH